MSTPPVRITVIINNRDLLAWPRAMVEKIATLDGVAEIIILDNGSTYRPLLAWYKTLPLRVAFLENLGHTAPWTSGVIDGLATDLYVVTDPDLDLSALPQDTLLRMAEHLARCPEAGKIGLSLATDGIPADSPYAQHVAHHAMRSANAPARDDGLIAFPVDTTFALYDRRVLNEYRIRGLRTPAPYVARHLPWHVVQPEGEFLYYLDHAEGSSCSYRWFTRHERSDSVRGLYARHQGKVSTKWDSYLDVYEDCFRPLKQQPVDLLEIGIQNGGSLDIWSKYFPRARSLTGCDINPRCSLLRYEDPRVQVIVGHVNEPDTYRRILERAPQFDIIIDDGSHRSHDVLTSFLSYFPLLKPGGLYLVEDMHCAYWEAYGGGIFNDRSPAAFFRHMLDAINRDHFKKDIPAGKLFQSFLPGEQFERFLDEHPVLNMSVHDSVFVLRKAWPQRPRGLGECVIVGSEALADPRVLAHRAAA